MSLKNSLAAKKTGLGGLSGSLKGGLSGSLGGPKKLIKKTNDKDVSDSKKTEPAV